MRTDARTSDDYKPCVAILPGGVVRRGNVKCVSLMTAEQVRAAIAANQAAFMSPDVYAAEFVNS